jgi:hypothetical protein
MIKKGKIKLKEELISNNSNSISISNSNNNSLKINRFLRDKKLIKYKIKIIFRAIKNNKK